jgi:hypothetical protein
MVNYRRGMRTLWRIAFPLVVGLGQITWGAMAAVGLAVKVRFVRDVTLQGMLAAAGSQEPLAGAHEVGDRRRLTAVGESVPGATP